MRKINHEEYQKKTKKMTSDELHYTIKDCRAAIEAMPEGENASYYADEINYCAMELKRRNTGNENHKAIEPGGTIMNDQITCGQELRLIEVLTRLNVPEYIQRRAIACLKSGMIPITRQELTLNSIWSNIRVVTWVGQVYEAITSVLW